MANLTGYIDNPSDQVYAYADEMSSTIKKISQKYKFDDAFALLIVQTAIEAMKIDCEQHKMIVFDKRLDDLISQLSDIIDIFEGCGGRK